MLTAPVSMSTGPPESQVFVRAHVTFDSQDHFHVGANFFGTQSKNFFAAAALPPSALQSSRYGPAPCQRSAGIHVPHAATITACRCTRHRNQHCANAGA